MINKILVVVFLIVLISTSVLALTGSIGNGYMAVLYPDLSQGSTIERTILVQNKNDVPISIKIEATGNNTEMFDIIDSSFVLQPREEKDARVNINVKKAGDYELNLNVFFLPIDGKGAGIALTATIIIHAIGKAPDNNVVTSVTSLFGKSTKGNGMTVVIFISTLVLVVIFIGLLFLLMKKEKKKKRSVRSS